MDIWARKGDQGREFGKYDYELTGQRGTSGILSRWTSMLYSSVSADLLISFSHYTETIWEWGHYLIYNCIANAYKSARHIVDAQQIC